MRCKFEAEAKIIRNYWRIVRTNVQRILRDTGKATSPNNNSSVQDKKSWNQNLKEKPNFALTMGISA